MAEGFLIWSLFVTILINLGLNLMYYNIRELILYGFYRGPVHTIQIEIYFD